MQSIRRKSLILFILFTLIFVYNSYAERRHEYDNEKIQLLLEQKLRSRVSPALRSDLLPAVTLKTNRTSLRDITLTQNESKEKNILTSEELIEFYAPKKQNAQGVTRGIGGVNTGHTIARKQFNNIFFDFNTYTLKPASYEQLDEVGKALDIVMKQHSRCSFTIEGHTDSIGGDTYNKVLSFKRAEAVKQYLVSRFQLDRSRILSVGFGESRPLAPNDTELGRRQNRRVEIIRTQ